MQSGTKKEKDSKGHPKENEKELYPKQNPKPEEEQMKATFTMAGPLMATPATVPATPNVPIISTLPVSTESTAFCETCLALGRPCPLFAPPAPLVSLSHSDWSNVEDDWDGERQKEEEREKNREHGKKELKDKIFFPPSPKYTPNTLSNTNNTLAPELTKTLVLTLEERQDEEKDKLIKEENKDTESDYDLDDAVTILRAEYVYNHKRENKGNKGNEIMSMYIVYCIFIKYT